MRTARALLLFGALGCSAQDSEEAQVGQALQPPDSQCTSATFDGVDYWYCANLRAFAQARARCEAIDMDLAVIDSATEDANLLTLIGEHAFIGARRIAGTTTWVWLGLDQIFWQGRHDGQAVGNAYTNWENGHPDPIAPFRRDCAVKKKTAPAAGGRWLSVKCDEPRPYVCEAIDLCPHNETKLKPGQCGCAVDDTDTDGDGTADCLDACPLDAAKALPGTCGCGVADVDTDGDGIVDCEDGCPNDAANLACAANDVLPVPPPWPTNPGTNPIAQTPVDPNNCMAETGALQPLGAGGSPSLTQALAMWSSVADPSPSTHSCERVQDPGDCPHDPASVTTTTCTEAADCPGAGYTCRYSKPAVCLAPGGGTLEECSTNRLLCGLPDPTCVADAPVLTCVAGDPTCTAGASPPDCAATNTCPCVQADVCPLGPYGNSDPGPGSDLSEDTIPTSAAIATNKRTDEPEPVYIDPPNLDCNAWMGHCWCELKVPTLVKFDDPYGKQSKHGTGNVVDFTFKPDVKFTVDAQPRPFGESKFDVEARAMFEARTAVNLLGVSGSATLVDIIASARADRCRFRTSDTQFKLLGVDFVDLLGIPLFDSDDALGTLGSECRSAFEDVEKSGHRAKKALRDAQVLVEAYRALPGGVGFLQSQLCTKIGSSPDIGFPSGTCATEVPEETINRYIAYYKLRAQQLRIDMRTLQAKSAALLSGLAVANPDHTIPFFNEEGSEGQNVVDLPFFIGPVPMHLDVEVLLNWNIRGDMVYSFMPSSILAMPAGTPTRLAGASAKLIPGATASVDMFVGAGISVPGFTVKAGVEGIIKLARVSANLEAGVGLSTVGYVDERTPPADLAAVGSGELMFPLRSHQLYADWFIGATAGLYEILDGVLNARVKLKALFFSKSWRKTIVSFKSPFGPFEFNLLQGGDRLATKVLPESALPKNSLGLFEMQLPFVEIAPLPVPTTQPTMTQDLTIPSKIGQLHWKNYCERPEVT
jgi:hypothetical protein